MSVLPEPLEATLATPLGAQIGRLALRFLTSETRILRAEEMNEGVKRGERWPLLDLSKPANKEFATLFKNRVLSRDLDWSEDDLPPAMELIKSLGKLRDWLTLLCRSHGIHLDIHRFEPVIRGYDSSSPKGMIGRWLRLVDWFDPDLLVCFLLAERTTVDDAVQLRDWGPVPRLFDRSIESLVLDRGVTDLHVHMGGVRAASVLWWRIISGELPLERIKRYSLEAIATAGVDRREQERLEREASRIRDFVSQFSEGRGLLGAFWSGAEHAASSAEGVKDTPIAAAMWRERLTLMKAFKELQSPTRLKNDDEYQEFEYLLDLYLFSRNRFAHKLRQPSETNQGLGVFRGYFHATKPLEKFAPAKRSPRDDLSLSLRKAGNSEVALFLRQSRNLKRVELRLGPRESPRSYHEFFEAWAAAEDDFKLVKRGLDVRFAIHLKRSADARSSSGETATLSFLRDMDRETAALHAFRADPAWSEHAWRIARIDLAGSERDATPDLATYCMNLVRGDPEALERLDARTIDNETHRFWLHQKAIGRDRACVGVPILGITCHAGEDFAQPVEGLFTIGSAIELLKLREGDSIGHGLAMGCDLARFQASLGDRRLTKRGVQFDALLWLYRRLRHIACDDAVTLHELEAWLRREFASIYETHIASLLEIEHLIMCRAQPVPANGPDARTDRANRIRWLEITKPAVVKRRNERVPIAASIAKWQPVLERVQVSLLHELANKGIVIEFNPSSNLRMLPIYEPADAPFVRMIRTMGGDLLATVNTDNPGSYGTRIENEYVILFHALRDADISRAQATAIIERMRSVGYHGVYWGGQPSSRLQRRRRNV